MLERLVARVVLGDGDETGRATVRAHLEQAGIVVCAAVGDAARAVSAVRQHGPDAVLLAMDLPGGTAGAVCAIAAGAPQIPIVMVTDETRDCDLCQALQAGVWAFAPRGAGCDGLLRALRGALAGEATLPVPFAWRLVEEARRHRRAPDGTAAQLPERLTGREREVLLLLADGLETAEIAGRLYVAPVTVRTHVATILRKLRVADRGAAVELVARARAPVSHGDGTSFAATCGSR